jgi:uncharacterized membrane protein YsdA (DUF1294 family)
MSVVLLIGLLILPVIAGQRSGVNFLWVIAYALIINLLTYWVYARDKRRAENGEWRMSEVRLHRLELLGGWPAAFLAQRRLRHKCSKRSYQIVFWLIVLAWQFAAVDSLQNWKFSRPALNWLEHTSERR